VLNLHAAAATAVRTLSSVRQGVVVSVWEDGSITAHHPDDPARINYGVPVYVATRVSEVPTVAAIKARLRASTTLRGLAVEDD
jgi:hypothetical protein